MDKLGKMGVWAPINPGGPRAVLLDQRPLPFHHNTFVCNNLGKYEYHARRAFGLFTRFPPFLPNLLGGLPVKKKKARASSGSQKFLYGNPRSLEISFLLPCCRACSVDLGLGLGNGILLRRINCRAISRSQWKFGKQAKRDRSPQASISQRGFLVRGANVLQISGKP